MTPSLKSSAAGVAGYYAGGDAVCLWQLVCLSPASALLQCDWTVCFLCLHVRVQQLTNT